MKLLQGRAVAGVAERARRSTAATMATIERRAIMRDDEKLKLEEKIGRDIVCVLKKGKGKGKDKKLMKTVVVVVVGWRRWMMSEKGEEV